MFHLQGVLDRTRPVAFSGLVVLLLASLLFLIAAGEQPPDHDTRSKTSPAPLSVTGTGPISTIPAKSTQPATETLTATPTAQATLAQPTEEQTPTLAYPMPGSTVNPIGHVVFGTGTSNVEQAFLSLLNEDDSVYLVIVSAQSTGVEGDVYRDLRQRYFRTTTGPDEGIDTQTEFCYPDCIFVLASEINVLGVSSWRGVLQHEYRHIAQAKNNPSLARDFRDPNGTFTTYAAFAEACADYGLNVAPIYRAQSRMNRLANVLGAGQQGLIEQACRGFISAYQDLVQQYNQKVGSANAFQMLFPPYR